MAQLNPGDKVRIASNPSKVGTLTDIFDGPVDKPKRRKVLVRFTNGDENFVLLASLEKVPEGLEGPYSLMRQGRYGRVQDLRGAITYHRLSGRLANLIYSLNTTNTDFYAYQFKPVLQFLDSPCKGILIADEVGLGKTIEAGLIWTELTARQDARHLLVVCPAMLCQKWQDELKNRFGIQAEIRNIQGVKKLIELIRKGDVEETVTIASMQRLRKLAAQDGAETEYWQDLEIEDTVFDLIIIDEAHYLRNPQTLTHQMGKLLRPICDNMALLSATPIHMKNDDLFYLLNILDKENFWYEKFFNYMIDANAPIVLLRDRILKEHVPAGYFLNIINQLSSNDWFKNSEQLKYLVNFPPNDTELASVNGRARLAERLDRLNPLTKVVARTRKRDVQERRVIRVPRLLNSEMTEYESKFYETVTNTVYNYCASIEMEKIATFILTMPWMQMASCMASAYNSWIKKTNNNLNEEYMESAYEFFGESLENEKNTFQSELIQIVADATRDTFSYAELKKTDSKYCTLRDSLCKYWQENPDNKVVLFSFFRGTLQYLQERLNEDGIKSSLVMGGMDKISAIEKFADPKGPDLLLSSEVAAEGVDLQFSSLLINYDLPWNPMRIEQRIGRIDRIGQKSEKILIWNFLHAGTIDEKIYNKLLERLNIFEHALGSIEGVLGDKIHSLGNTLLTHKFTEDEQERLISQTAMAIENYNRTQEHLEEESSRLIAHGEYIQSKVVLAKELGRYITDIDLSIYVREFLEREYEGTKFINTGEKSEEKYNLKLSITAQSDLLNFLQAYGLANRTRILRRQDELLVRFANKTGTKEYNVEIITQYHPIVRFVSEALRKKGKTGGYFPVSAITLRKANVPFCRPGVYVYAVQRWSVSGVRDTEQLEYAVKSYDDGTILDKEQAEKLVNIAAMFGEDWLSVNGEFDSEQIANWYDECSTDIEDGYQQFIGDIQRENNDRINMMINTIDKHRKEQTAKIEERITRHKEREQIHGKDQGKWYSLARAEQGKLKKLNKKLDDRIAMLHQKQQIKSESGSVSGGIIKVY